MRQRKVPLEILKNELLNLTSNSMYTGLGRKEKGVLVPYSACFAVAADRTQEALCSNLRHRPQPVGADPWGREGEGAGGWGSASEGNHFLHDHLQPDASRSQTATFGPTYTGRKSLSVLKHGLIHYKYMM